MSVFFRLSPRRKFVLLQKQPFWIIWINFSNFSTKFTPYWQYKIWQTMLWNPYITFESQLGIIISNMLGLYFASQTSPFWFFPNVKQCVKFHSDYLLLWVKEHFCSTLGRNIPFEIGHISDMETIVSNSKCFIFMIF